MSTPKNVSDALTLNLMTGLVTGVLADPRTPAHLIPRADPHTLTTARELHEAADRAEEGYAPPGSKAAALYAHAIKDGDLATASEILQGIISTAPLIRAAAVEAEQAEAEARDNAVREAVVTLSTLERAQQKRARKAAARANMQHGARNR